MLKLLHHRISILWLLIPFQFQGYTVAQTAYPSIFLKAKSHESFRSMEDFKSALPGSRVQKYIESVKNKASEDLKLPFIDPTTPYDGRDSVHLRHQNVSYDMAIGIRDRLSRAAFLYLLTKESIYKELIMDQIVALGDTSLWPLWCDQAHLSEKPYVDIRTFQISMWVALCFNWLHDDLSTGEKAFILDLIDRRAIQPFWEKLAQKPHWYIHRHNWFTNIFSGMGITAMALGKNHPETNMLLDTIVPQMIQFNSIIGDDGEFNEPPGYAGVVRYSVEFAEAYRYYTGNEINLLTEHPFPALCYWMMYHTIPPQRLMAFGDTPIDAHPRGSEVMAAVANASRDEILQWYYHANFSQIGNIMELLWYDPSLASTNPKGKLRLSKAYDAYSASLISRTSWDQNSTACVVYGKAGREANHDDNDVGQLLIDGYGKRLIIDCGKPDPIYPSDYFRDTIQYNYYTRSTRGHNVLMIGNREMRSEPNAVARGEIVDFWSDDDLGASWTIDLTPVYPGTKKVVRKVAHLFPGIIAVMDKAHLERAEDISLRWHTAGDINIDSFGNFKTNNKNVELIGKIIPLNGDEIELSQHRHYFEPPYHLSRQGDPLIQVNQNYVEYIHNTKEYATLTLFAISDRQSHNIQWNSVREGWQIDLSRGTYLIKIENGNLILSDYTRQDRTIEFPLK